MPTIGGLHIPILPNVPRANWTIGKRTKTLYFTVHYNGPKVPGAGYPKLEAEQIRNDARYHMRRGALGVPSGGDGIQYHGGTFSDGSNWIFRGIYDLLWHCRNFEGNNYSFSWHIPIGAGQVPTKAQNASLVAVIDACRREWPNIAVTGVKGHKEWSITDCPGIWLMSSILDYRNTHTVGTPIQYFKTIVNANCREAPDVGSDIALNGTAVTPANTIFGVDAIVKGVPYRPNGAPYPDDDTYVHRADHVGFYHMSVVQSLTANQYRSA